MRHAPVEEAFAERVYGQLDVPLSALGRERSEELGRALAAHHPAALACSPLARARALADAVVAHSPTGSGPVSSGGAAASSGLEVTPDLIEIDRGRWTNRLGREVEAEFGHEVRAFHDDPWSFTGHGGECDADVAARAWPALERTLERAGGGTAVVVSHYNVIRVLLGLALGMRPADTFRLRLDPGCCALLVDGPSGWDLGPFNVRAPDPARERGGEVPA